MQWQLKPGLEAGCTLLWELADDPGGGAVPSSLSSSAHRPMGRTREDPGGPHTAYLRAHWLPVLGNR